MKLNKLSTVFLLFLCLINFTGCNDYLLSEKDEEKEDEEEWFDYIPDGDTFVEDGRALRFYYIDEKGNGMIDPNNADTYPVSWRETLDYPISMTRDYDRASGYYNAGFNRIAYDPEEGMYYATLLIYGDERQSSYTFPVHAFGYTDWINIAYLYSYNIIGGSRYFHKVISWEYNGTYIYSDEEEYLYENGKRIFIRRNNGKTDISYRR